MSVTVMIWFVAGSVYVAVGFIIGCRLATMLAWHFCRQGKIDYPYAKANQQAPDGEQWIGAMVLCCTAAVAAWPFLLVVYMARHGLFKPPADIRLAQQKARIAELEQELSLR